MENASVTRGIKPAKLTERLVFIELKFACVSVTVLAGLRRLWKKM